jgi:hypothetical protein
MRGVSMQDDRLDVDVRPRKPYPWARALLVIVLYISLLLFLWHFPTNGVRLFFRNLIAGFGYVVAGLALIGLTVGVFFLIPPPLIVRGVGEEEAAPTEDVEVGCVRLGRVLMVPAIRQGDRMLEIWDLLDNLLADLDSKGTFVIDQKVGAVTVVGDDDEDVETLLDEAYARLQEEGFRARFPH